MADVSFFTPACSRDIDRFLIQRESIERCGIEIPHTVVVDHEAISQFRDLPFQKNLTIVSTRDVLDSSIEKRRLAWGMRRRNLKRWWLAGASSPIHGWGIQQYLKLGASRVLANNAIVCIDCDTFFVGHLDSKDFVDSHGKTHMYETTYDIDAEMAEWPAISMHFLGIKSTGLTLYRYTHSPVVFDRNVLIDLQHYIEKRYSTSWMTAFADGRMIMEYTTYGVYAREIDGLERVSPTHPPHSLYYWWPDEIARFKETFVSRVQETKSKIVGIQSRTDLSQEEFRTLASKVWP